MANYVSDAPQQWVPELIAAHVDEALGRASIAYQVGTVLRTPATEVKIPTVTSHPVAAFGAEGSTLNESDPGLDGFTVIPKRLGVVSKVSREFYDDQTQISRSVLQGQALDVARAIDAALFAETPGTNDPAGLGAATGVTSVDAGSSWENVDPFTEAMENAAGCGTTVNSWCANPATAKALGVLKTGTDSNLPLLGSDPTLPGRRQILGAPLYVSEYVPDDAVWGIPQEHLHIVQRGNVEAEVDESIYFTSYAVALRTVTRVAFGIAYPAAFQLISLDTAGS